MDAAAETQPKREAWNKGKKWLKGATIGQGPLAELIQLTKELEAVDGRRSEIEARIKELRPHLEKILRAAGIPTD